MEDRERDERHLGTLHALRVKGLGRTEDVERISGIGGTDVVLAELVADGLATEHGGWFAPTPAGIDRDREALREGLGDEAAALEVLYERRFLPINVRFKSLATSWQEGEQFELVERAAEIHDEIDALLSDAERYAPHLGRYRERLAELMDAFLSGQGAVLTAAAGPSYHNTWFELHEDLITTLGRVREKEAA